MFFEKLMEIKFRIPLAGTLGLRSFHRDLFRNGFYFAMEVQKRSVIVHCIDYQRQCFMGVSCRLSATVKLCKRKRQISIWSGVSSITNRCCHDHEASLGDDSFDIHYLICLSENLYWRPFAKPASLASKNNNKVYLLSSTDVDLPSLNHFTPQFHAIRNPCFIPTLDLNPTSSIEYMLLTCSHFPFVWQSSPPLVKK